MKGLKAVETVNNAQSLTCHSFILPSPTVVRGFQLTVEEESRSRDQHLGVLASKLVYINVFKKISKTNCDKNYSIIQKSGSHKSKYTVDSQ